MRERKLLGTIPVDSGQISIVDPAHIVTTIDFGWKMKGGDSLIVETEIGDGRFPVYFEKDADKGGYGKSRIIIELGPMGL